ncbi:MAG TPA: EAL domain-containing protein [Thermoanaerobaculia bacterium]|jgi:EAL domain-containing protein (putative c-di-GMP-specific phosphodiesterase class I)
MSEHSALNTILRPGGITPLFQPIVRVDENGASLHAVECLSRGPAGTNFAAASVLFDYVRLKREESLVDRACISAAFGETPKLPGSVHLAVNVHASTLGRDVGFVPFLQAVAAKYAIAMERITVEVVEHAPPWDNRSFLDALDALRACGAKLAVDDVGLGQSNFKMLIDVSPDYLKLDRYFVASCASDAKRRAVVSAVTQLAREFGAQVVAEGVEEPHDVGVLRNFGITLMQGYLYAKPMPAADVAGYVAAA